MLFITHTRLEHWGVSDGPLQNGGKKRGAICSVKWQCSKLQKRGKELKTLLAHLQENPKLCHELSMLEICWEYIPLKAPWCVGLLERMVGTVKASHNEVLHKASLTYLELYTVVSPANLLFTNHCSLPEGHWNLTQRWWRSQASHFTLIYGPTT